MHPLWEKEKPSQAFQGGVFEISCETNHGIDSFLDSLTNTVTGIIAGEATGDDLAASEGAMITRARHRQHVQAAVEALERFEVLSTQGMMTVDLAAEELRLAASELGRITGAVDVEDVLDKLFADFCIGSSRYLSILSLVQYYCIVSCLSNRCVTSIFVANHRQMSEPIHLHRINAQSLALQTRGE